MSDFIWPTGGGHGPSTADQVVTHRLRVDPSRRMSAITGEVEALLGGLNEGSRRSGALLASELIAQVVGRKPRWESDAPVSLTIQVRGETIRLEATGPIAPSIGRGTDHGGGPTDPLAEWGPFILDQLADRWGVGEGSRSEIWAVMDAPPPALHRVS